MEWWKDYSKVLGLAMLAAGLTLILVGYTDIGIPLLAAATGVALGKSGGTKVTGVLLLAVLALPLAGCQTGMVRVDAIEPALTSVMERHDTYVKEDPNLTDLMKEIYLRTTELLRKLLEEAKK
jgi:hypothetical protein